MKKDRKKNSLINVQINIIILKQFYKNKSSKNVTPIVTLKMKGESIDSLPIGQMVDVMIYFTDEISSSSLG